MDHENHPRRSSNAMPIAIVLAALVIGASVYLVYRKPGAVPASANPAAIVMGIPNPTKEDHILGNPNAPVVIVEYTDLECPYCKNFHNVMRLLMDAYGKKGQLAWIVRNFPVPQLHPLALKEHEAAECAADLGGNDAFFEYIDKVFVRTPSNNRLDPNLLPVIAGEVGLDKNEFMACLNSGKFTEKVKNQAAEAFSGGATGTPYNVIIFKGEKFAVPGAQPYKVMRSLIDSLLMRQSGNSDAIPVYNAN